MTAAAGPAALRGSCRELLCWGPGPSLSVRDFAVPEPRPTEVVVRVRATSVNPIDVKRAQGYGHRLLALRGAASFPRVLGNDLVGTVTAVGARVTSFRLGDRVLGVVPTGPRGAHATHAVTAAQWLRHAPQDASDERLAALPYSFISMWRAVAATGLDETSAAGRRVALLGAGGGLGRLAIDLLSRWGAETIAIAGDKDHEACKAVGATDALAASSAWHDTLASSCHAALNFASWSSDARLSLCLRPDALGQATTVHPLMEGFDRHGWIGGATHGLAAFRGARKRVRAHARSARYGWTLFAPDARALDALGAAPPDLPIGIRRDLDGAQEAFAHVASRWPGRAVLVP